MKVLRNLMLCVTFFSALALPSATYAQFVDGKTLKDWADAGDRLSDDTDFSQASQFIGYVTGVMDVIYVLNSGVICLSANVTVGQLTAIVKKYVREHPEEWHLVASSLVFKALVEQFPCPESSP
jgi:hypothetical protein